MIHKKKCDAHDSFDLMASGAKPFEIRRLKAGKTYAVGDVVELSVKDGRGNIVRAGGRPLQAAFKVTSVYGLTPYEQKFVKEGYVVLGYKNLPDYHFGVPDAPEPERVAEAEAEPDDDDAVLRNAIGECVEALQRVADSL